MPFQDCQNSCRYGCKFSYWLSDCRVQSRFLFVKFFSGPKLKKQNHHSMGNSSPTTTESETHSSQNKGTSTSEIKVEVKDTTEPKAPRKRPSTGQNPYQLSLGSRHFDHNRPGTAFSSSATPAKSTSRQHTNCRVNQPRSTNH